MAEVLAAATLTETFRPANVVRTEELCTAQEVPPGSERLVEDVRWSGSEEGHVADSLPALCR